MVVTTVSEQATWLAIREVIYAPPEMSDATALECVLATLRQGLASDDQYSYLDDGYADESHYEGRREACFGDGIE